MRIDILTIFPEIFDLYFQYSLIKKAVDKKIIKIKTHNLRDFSNDKRKTVDDKPFGGGRGMVLKVEPIKKAVNLLTKNKRQKTKIILFSPRGKQFNQKMATNFSKLDKIIMVCGRYEAIDERIKKYVADEVVSIGDFVLMGGELPAIMAIEAISRLIPGVIGKPEMLKQRITKTKGFIEYPQYTRPEIVEIKGKKRKVPKILLSGDHKKIDVWRAKRSKVIG